MIRDSKGSIEFWNLRVEQKDARIEHMLEQSKLPAGDATYAPQYLFEIVKECLHQMMRRYSRGDSREGLSKYFVPLLEAWEESERLGREVFSPELQYTRRAWIVNFDHYIVCFWLVGLALALEVPDEQWNRLLALIGNEGEDVLLDRIIASRSPQRRIGTELCFKKPYARLLEAIDSPKETQSLKLLDFVTHWYDEMAVIGTSGRAKQATPYQHPYWHRLGNENFEGGAYFGRWCVEAVAAVKAFGVDDRPCLGHQHYPGDLLHEGQPSTSSADDVIADQKQARRSWFSRILRRP
jgi:hypothetical protein